MRSFVQVSSDRYAFRVGRRVCALQQFDATREDIEQSIGVAIVSKTYGASITGTLDQLDHMAEILDVTNTLDGCTPEYRRASIAAARRLRTAIAEMRAEINARATKEAQS